MAVKTTEFTKTRQRLDQPSGAENRMNATARPHRLWSALGVLLLVGMIVGARYVLNGNDSPADPRDNQPLTPGVLATGFVEPAKGLANLHPLQGGEVTWVIKEGEQVDEGAVLLKLDNKRQLAQEQQAKAALQDAELLVEK